MSGAHFDFKSACKKDLSKWLRREDLVKLAYMVELLLRNHYWGSKIMQKGSSGPRWTKTGQKSSGTKSFGLTNQSLKSFGQMRGSMCSKEFMTELLPNVSYQP